MQQHINQTLKLYLKKHPVEPLDKPEFWAWSMWNPTQDNISIYYVEWNLEKVLILAGPLPVSNGTAGVISLGYSRNTYKDGKIHLKLMAGNYRGNLPNLLDTRKLNT